MCTLFPFSLADKGERWLNSLPPASLRSWSEVRNAFLDYFYTKGKTAQLRNKIITFKQNPDESFGEAWDKYKEYRRDCPHHGYSDDQLIRFFYDGLVFEYRMALDAASNGDFNTQSVEGAYRLLENMAQSSHKKSYEFDRTIRAPSTHTNSGPAPKEVIAAQMEELLKLYNSQREVHMVTEEEPNQQETNEEAETEEEVAYVNGQRYDQNRGYNYNSYQRSNPLFSWRSNNVANPQDQHYPTQQSKPFTSNQGYQNQQLQGSSSNQRWNNSNVQRNQSNNSQGYQPKQNNQAPEKHNSTNMESTFLEELQAMINKENEKVQFALKDLHESIVASYADTNAKFELLETRIRKAEVQVAQTSELAKRQLGTLPGKAEQNPKKDVCLVKEDATDVKEMSTTSLEKEESNSFAEEKESTQEETTEKVVVKKLEDPGQVTLSIEIKGEVFSQCLCDLGSSVNLMSQYAADKLGITSYEPTNIVLRFADHSEKRPIGLLENVPVILNDVPIPTDFVILELGEEPKDSILLGRPFLCTAGAVIDVRKKSIDLNLDYSKTKTERGKVMFDPGAKNFKSLFDEFVGSNKNAETLNKSMFENPKVFAGIPKTGPDKVTSLMNTSQTLDVKMMQVDTCNGLGAVTRPPDAN